MSEVSDRLSHDYAILSQKLLRQTPKAGLYESDLAGLSFARRDDPERRENVLYPPCVGIVVQGSKQAVLGTREVCYQRGQYILCCVDMPSSFSVSCSADRPYLTAVLRLDFPLLVEIFRELDARRSANGSADAAYADDGAVENGVPEDFADEDADSPAAEAPALTEADEDDSWEDEQGEDPLGGCTVECGVQVCDITPELLNAFLRLVYLLDKDPEERSAILPLIVREIHYYLATGPGGRALRTFLMTRTQSWQILRAITHMRRHCSERLPIESLARLVHMAESTFNRNFKRVTTLSPLQYHKRLKLFEARRLMLQKGMNAATACAAVGYESQQQFTREYKRLFGCPPMKDARRVR